MKLLILILLIGITSVSFCQSKPEQKLLTEDYLWGKSPTELRIMRNEIFARYGYKFNSDDLKKYFSNLKWYIPKHDDVNSFLTVIDKKNITLIADFEKNKANNFISEVYDSSIVKLIKVSRVNSSIPFNRQIEVTYPRNNWKKTVERFSYGAEEVPTIITIEYINDSPYKGNNHPYWEMKKYVDDLKVHHNYLQTIDYDIVDNYNELFPFFHDEPVACYDGNKCYRFRIPNSKIPKFWIAYSYTAGINEDVGAKIYLSDINGIINELSITSKSGKTGYLEDEGFKVVTFDSEDRVDKSEINLYELWSSEKSESRDDINEFKIVINGVFNIEIPIINGCFFGNKDKKQTLILE